ncbi:CYTH domain-containing protein [Muribacter muris]|uniref:CYTH domain-containing protein n=1 Tax=Muribacter muris TaxID=67855 RepID=A0A4Y9K8M1_9PAST|nr:CYTH domain-containing protein [Muribacter muris]MBF0784254.1 CYTH domain-containing protein [Muribacter muris]MBF0827008.1 CYTH domain-containing protein [Muribacter muris]TFV12995.1 CYTH domain-containing protein [Muribacter muris]
MENEIELKLMLNADNIPVMLNWLARLPSLAQGQDLLANCYYDTADQFFAHHKMGLRVRTKNQRHELTLKTAGNIVGGLHIRPEYNLALPNNQPDFAALVAHYQLQFGDIGELHPIFSTDFERQYWLVAYQGSQIEIALDQGWIKNAFGKAPICELEFELKQGKIADLFDLLDTLPNASGIWLSSLSKAQRGYLVGNAAEIAKNTAKLTACHREIRSPIEQYQQEQQLVDFIRLTQDPALIALYHQQNPDQPIDSVDYLYSNAYLARNLAIMRSLALR